MLTGNNIFIALGEGGTAPIVGTQSDSFQTDCDMIEASGPESGQWEEYVDGRKKWAFTTDFLVGNAEDIDRLLMVGENYHMAVFDRSGHKILTGSARCQQCRTKQSVHNLIKGAFSFQGNGELKKYGITSLSVDSSYIRVNKGESYQVTVTGTPADALAIYTWTSMNTAVATVDSNGLVTGVSAGTTFVRVIETRTGLFYGLHVDVMPAPSE